MKIKALKKFLIENGEFTKKELRDSEIVEDSDYYDVCGNRYLVLTEDERDVWVTEHIKESLWAFNSWFLAGETNMDETIFEALSEKCEDGNNAILSLIEKTCGLEAFIEAVVSIDGCGHFLSPYDGNEGDVEVGNKWYFIYRIN